MQSTLSIPNMLQIAAMNARQLGTLTITQAQWRQNSLKLINFTLSDGQTCTAGTFYVKNNRETIRETIPDDKLDQSHTFDSAKKITKIETIIFKAESLLMQINFYHYEERLVQMG